MPRLPLALLVAGLLLVAGGVVTSVVASDGPGAKPFGADAASSSARPVTLTVRYVREPGRAPRRAALRCGQTPRGTEWLRRPEVARTACRVVRAQASVLTRGEPRDRACTEIYGGTQRARVSGRVGEDDVTRVFSREDGCKIADWDALRPLLPRAATR